MGVKRAKHGDTGKGAWVDDTMHALLPGTKKKMVIYIVFRQVNYVLTVLLSTSIVQVVQIGSRSGCVLERRLKTQ